jgi:hypothetical protein
MSYEKEPHVYQLARQSNVITHRRWQIVPVEEGIVLAFGRM